MAELVQSTTRGEGFTETGNPTGDLAAVIVLATARLPTNPSQLVRKDFADVSFVHRPFDGFTMAERLVLHRYRKRSA